MLMPSHVLPMMARRYLSIRELTAKYLVGAVRRRFPALFKV